MLSQKWLSETQDRSSLTFSVPKTEQVVISVQWNGTGTLQVTAVEIGKTRIDMSSAPLAELPQSRWPVQMVRACANPEAAITPGGEPTPGPQWQLSAVGRLELLRVNHLPAPTGLWSRTRDTDNRHGHHHN